MQVLVRSDHTVANTEGLTGWIERTVAGGLERFGERITRVEVYLSDENGEKGGTADKRCNVEAHVGGLKPLAAHAHAGTVDEAVMRAVDKLWRVLDHELGKMDEMPGRSPPEDQVASTLQLDQLERAEAARGAAERTPQRPGRQGPPDK